MTLVGKAQTPSNYYYDYDYDYDYYYYQRPQRPA